MNDEWLARQFRGKTVAEVVRDCGWLHTAGGTGVDLSLFARNIVAADALVRRDVFEVPAVRDSMMLVHRDDEVQGWFEYDGERLVWRMRNNKRPRDVAHVAREVETFIREILGDLRHYAADNEKNRAARVAWVRGD